MIMTMGRREAKKKRKKKDNCNVKISFVVAIMINYSAKKEAKGGQRSVSSGGERKRRN